MVAEPISCALYPPAAQVKGEATASNTAAVDSEGHTWAARTRSSHWHGGMLARVNHSIDLHSGANTR